MSQDNKIGSPCLRAAAFIFLAAGSLIMLFPFFWMISGSLKTLREITSPKIIWWPAEMQCRIWSGCLRWEIKERRSKPGYP